MKLVLHNYWRSSASHRVRIGLGLKQLAFEYRHVGLGGAQKSDDYTQMNPMQQLPTLEIIENDGTHLLLTQSLPILEYLEERWPEHPILPRDPYLRARCRALAEIINSGIQPLQNHRQGPRRVRHARSRDRGTVLDRRCPDDRRLRARSAAGIGTTVRSRHQQARAAHHHRSPLSRDARVCSSSSRQATRREGVT
jgi:glutathione S-transferase